MVVRLCSIAVHVVCTYCLRLPTFHCSSRIWADVQQWCSVGELAALVVVCQPQWAVLWVSDLAVCSACVYLVELVAPGLGKAAAVRHHHYMSAGARNMLGLGSKGTAACHTAL